jgi:nicotinamidase-related amidase
MLRAGYRVMVLIDAVFAVDVKDGDGERAIVEMAARGAEMVTTGQIEA